MRPLRLRVKGHPTQALLHEVAKNPPIFRWGSMSIVLSYGGIKRLSNGIGVSYSPVSTHDFDSCSTSSNLVAPTILEIGVKLVTRDTLDVKLSVRVWYLQLIWLHGGIGRHECLKSICPRGCKGSSPFEATKQIVI